MPVYTQLLPPRYRSPRRIGRGAMGDIYLATDDVLGREVAVKALADRYAADESIRQRFKREALSAARLSSEPGAITIYDVGEWEGRPFIVMEHLAGGSLEERHHEKRFPAAVVVYLADVLDADDVRMRRQAREFLERRGS